MTLCRLLVPALTLLALAGCAGGDGAGGPLGPTAADVNPGSSPGLETVAPGAEGLYEGDPIAGPNMDPPNDDDAI